MPLVYRVPLKDTGYNEAVAIQPIDNGEPANADTYRRPSENLRTRSEDIRAQFDALEAVVSADRGLTIMAAKDTYVTWNSGAGTFTIDDNDPSPTDRDMWITPLLGTATVGGGVDIQAQWVYKEGANGFKVGANTDLRDFGDSVLATESGANNIFFKLIQGLDNVGLVDLYTEGDTDGTKTYPADGPVTVVIEYSPGPTYPTTFSDIVSALQGTGGFPAPPAEVQAYLDHANAATVGAGGTTVAGTVAEPQRIYDGAVGTAPDTSMGALDPQSIKITPAMWTAFWSAYTNLPEGDMVVVDFTDAVDRLNNVAASDMTNMLVRVDANSAHTAGRHVVPVCKVFGSRLYFVNGRGFDDGEPGKLVSDPGAVETESSAFTKHMAGTSPFRHTDTQIDGAIKTDSPRSLAAATTSAQLIEMLAHYNAHVGAGTQDKHTDSVVDALSKGGVDPTTSIDSTLGAGNTSSQMALLNDRYRTTAGGANVGATQKTGTGASKTLLSYTTAGQLQSLLDYYDNHILNTAPADQHSIGAVSDKPFVVVDAVAGNGDYQTIAAAIAANGAAHYVLNPGSYSELVARSSGDEIAIFEAASLGTVIWEAPTGFNAFQISGNDDQVYIFRNIVFTTDDTAALIEIGGGSGSSLIFENCVFLNGSITTHQLLAVSASGAGYGIKFFNCTIENDSAANGAFGVHTATATKLDVIIKECQITGYRSFLKYDNTNDDDMGQFRFHNNVFDDCAYTKADGTAHAPFFHMTCGASSDHLEFDISHNIWKHREAGTPSELDGNLCLLYGAGTISHNIFSQDISYSVGTLPKAFVHCGASDPTTFGSRYGVSVIGNKFYHKKGAAIALTRGSAIGNEIWDVERDNGLEGIVEVGGEVIGNYIYCDNHASAIGAVVFATSGEVSGNHIQADDNVKGVHVKGGTCKITGNTIDLNGSSNYGVYLDGPAGGTVSDFTYRCVVAGNSIANANTGIYADGLSNDNAETPWGASMHALTGNTIKLPASGTPVGIEVFKPYMVITGNIITSDNWDDGGAQGEGIELNNNDAIACSGNFIMPGVTTDFNGTGGTGVGVGATGAADLNHNWYGYVWATPI